MDYGGRRMGKSLLAIEAAKFAQMQGKRSLFATYDQVATAAHLAKHGALSEIVGDNFVAPRWPKSKLNKLER